MSYRIDENKYKRVLETGVMLSVFLIFAMTGISLVALGAKSYKLIGEDMAHNFQVRTPSAYITMKVRQNDRLAQVQIKSLEGVDVLILQEKIEGITYETLIYAYQGMLREVYIEEGTKIKLADGIEVLELQHLDLEWVGHSLQITFGIEEGEYEEIILTPRTNQLEGESL